MLDLSDELALIGLLPTPRAMVDVENGPLQ
jgi:hypothetical protein